MFALGIFLIYYFIILEKNKLNIISQFFWYVGYCAFIIYDLLIIILKPIIRFCILFIKYFIFYPSILYFFIFFIINNPIIYVQFIYIIKLIILPFYNFFYIIFHQLNDCITIILSLENRLVIDKYCYDLKTVESRMNAAYDLYWEIWERISWWWLLRKVNYDFFLYYTPLDYLWYEGFYAFFEMYDFYKHITYYIYMYIYTLIISYFWSFIYIISKISGIFKWMNYLSLSEFIFYYIYTSKIIYFSLLKIYVYMFYIFLYLTILLVLLYIYLLLCMNATSSLNT